MKASNILITDYSSIVFEYSLLQKPMFFYAYDLNEYEKKSRGFYVDYCAFVPGPISSTTSELIEQIQNYNQNLYSGKMDIIAHMYQRDDGLCTKRFVEYFF